MIRRKLTKRAKTLFLQVQAFFNRFKIEFKMESLKKATHKHILKSYIEKTLKERNRYKVDGLYPPV